jgi:hypothetical protein
MNLVDWCVEQVINGANDISEYLLKLAFDNPNNGYGGVWGPINTEYSIEQGIREKVFIKMIAPLLNVAGGTTEIIDLSGARIRNLSGGVIAVNVPDALTGGRKILSVIEVYPGNITSIMGGTGNVSSGATCGGGAIVNGLNRLVNGLDNSNVQRVYTTFTMTGNNSFIIRDAGSAMFNMIAKVILSYDEHFSVIPPKAYSAFLELVELGVKTYIYKNCRRGMQEAVQKFGVSIDEVKDDIEKYSDSYREFKDLFENSIKKHLAYADPKGVSDTIKMIVPRKR